jgi:hypothetical protein
MIYIVALLATTVLKLGTISIWGYRVTLRLFYPPLSIDHGARLISERVWNQRWKVLAPIGNWTQLVYSIVILFNEPMIMKKIRGYHSGNFENNFFWDVTPCILTGVHGFVRKIHKPVFRSNQDGNNMFLRNVFNSTRLDGVTSHKINI